LQQKNMHNATSVQFTALPEIDETPRIVARLGMSTKPWNEIEDTIKAIIQGDEQPHPAQPQQTLLPPPPQPLPQPSGGGVARPSRKQLPEGWSGRQIATNTGRVYPVYHGPNDATARSIAEAWRIANGAVAPPHPAAAGDSPAAQPETARGLPSHGQQFPPRARGAHGSSHGSNRGAGPSGADDTSEGSAPAPQTAALPPHARGLPSHGNLRGAQSSLRDDSSQSAGDAATIPPPSPGGRVFRPSPMEGRDSVVPQAAFYEFEHGQCGTPGCPLRDKHAGICPPLQPQGRKRTRD
jgi:hypothetical protein